MALKQSLSKKLYLLPVFLSTFLLTFITGSVVLAPYASDATTTSTSVDVIVDVGSVLSIRATPTLVDLSLTPTPSGTEVHRELTITVNTNNSTGYTLSMNTESNNTALVHTNATNEIPSTSSPTPASLPVNRWGYNMGTGATTFLRIPPLNDSDTINSSSGPVIDHDTIITLGTKIDSGSMAGLYSNILVFTATTNYVPIITPCGTEDYECILFTINTTDGTYAIPTSGRVASMDHTYDWDVYVDGVLTTDCPSGNCTGTGGWAGPDGIPLTGLSSGQHQIKILPNGSPTPGWGNAFGHGWSGQANTSTNKEKLISIDAPLTTMAFAPKTTESTTDASWMFASLFADCTNLTTAATFKDTYKLPSTITDLSFFLAYAHQYSTNLTTPINLAPMAGWLAGNNSITNLESFMEWTHANNETLAIPINLTPLADWFGANQSITNMQWFFIGIHLNNSQTIPIDLTPLAGWFSANNSVQNLGHFMGQAYGDNIDLTAPIDLSPLSGWFSANTSITNLSDFLGVIHQNNSSLSTPINFAPLSGWFNSNTSITNLSGFLERSHENNSSLSTPINLAPLSGWFTTNNSITSLSYFLQSTHSDNPELQTPINLAPLSGWFSANTSITTLRSFLNETHNNNLKLTAPINLTPLSGWFGGSRYFSSLDSFLYRTHYDNPSLTLSGQTIFPNWIKTARQNPTTDIWSVNYAFSRTFYTSTTKNGDTGEPRFEDGTVLSSLSASTGAPNANRQTFTNRSGITPVNPNWQ